MRNSWFRIRLRTTFSALAACAVAAVPAAALDVGVLDLGDGLSIQATVEDTSSGAVLVRTLQGLSALLPGGLQYELDGRRVELGALDPGRRIDVRIPGGRAELLALDGELATLRTSRGIVQVPVSALPASAQAQTRVRVLKHNGKVVEVPLNAALNMRRAQGARILGSARDVARRRDVWPVDDVRRRRFPGVVIERDGDRVVVAVPRGGDVELLSLAADRIDRSDAAPGQVVHGVSRTGDDAERDEHPGRGRGGPPDDHPGKGHGRGGPPDDRPGKGHGEGPPGHARR